MSLKWRKTLAVTVLAIALSLAITLTMLWLFGDPEIAMILVIATLCPLLIAPPVTYFFAVQADRELALTGQLNAAHDKLMVAYGRLEEQARLDGLTGLLNRSAFFGEAEKLVHDGRTGTLLLLDLDHFKYVNDTFGHSSGDAALVSVAEMVSKSISARGLVGRVGGEEFGILLPDATASAGYEAAEQLRLKVRNMPSPVADPYYVLTISIGCARIESGAYFPAVYEEADQNLYRAKGLGRDRTVDVLRKTAA